MLISVGTYPTHDEPTIEIVEEVDEFSPDLLAAYPITKVSNKEEIERYINKHKCKQMERTYSFCCSTEGLEDDNGI